MRCSGWSSLAISVCSAVALALPGSGSAHVVPSPSFIPAGEARLVELSFPNERDRTMVGFSIAVPSGLEILHAHAAEGWHETLDDAKANATWRGGTLASGAATTFSVELRAERDPGAVELEAEQQFDDGETVTWPVALTVTPGPEEPSENLALAGVVGLIGLLVIAAIAALAWRRKA